MFDFNGSLENLITKENFLKQIPQAFGLGCLWALRRCLHDISVVFLGRLRRLQVLQRPCPRSLLPMEPEVFGDG